MTRPMAARRRKLNVRTPLVILRQDEVDLDADDIDAQRNVPKVETGVEKAEEIVCFDVLRCSSLMCCP